MKKFILFFTLMLSVFSVVAQDQSIIDPTIEPTVTPEQISAFAQNVPDAPLSTIVLTFEGCGNVVPVGNFYNGGAGGSYGITFNANTYSAISSDAGGSGNFCGSPTMPTCMIFTSGVGAQMNVAGGFTTGFSFYYSSKLAITISVWSGLNGTGSLLATQVFPANYNTTVGPAYTCTCVRTWCHWDPVGVAFPGTAYSVTFAGGASQCAFDDITLGASSPVTLPTVVATAATTITLTGFNANWNTATYSGTLSGYYLDVSLSNTFGTFVSGYNNLNVGNVTTYPVTGLTPGTTYYYRVRAEDTNGIGPDSNVITATTVTAVIPTLSEWGLIILGILLVGISTVYILRGWGHSA